MNILYKLGLFLSNLPFIAVNASCDCASGIVENDFCIEEHTQFYGVETQVVYSSGSVQNCSSTCRKSNNCSFFSYLKIEKACILLSDFKASLNDGNYMTVSGYDITNSELCNLINMRNDYYCWREFDLLKCAGTKKLIGTTNCFIKDPETPEEQDICMCKRPGYIMDPEADFCWTMLYGYVNTGLELKREQIYDQYKWPCKMETVCNITKHFQENCNINGNYVMQVFGNYLWNFLTCSFHANHTLGLAQFEARYAGKGVGSTVKYGKYDESGMYPLYVLHCNCMVLPIVHNQEKSCGANYQLSGILFPKVPKPISNVHSFLHCQEICKLFQSCYYLTYDPKFGLCWMFEEVNMVMPNNQLLSGPHKCSHSDDRFFSNEDLSSFLTASNDSISLLKSKFSQWDDQFLGLKCNIPIPNWCLIMGGFDFSAKPISSGSCFANTEDGIFKDDLVPLNYSQLCGQCHVRDSLGSVHGLASPMPSNCRMVQKTTIFLEEKVSCEC